ncbi:patatin-like phospholipase family protein [Parashewanella tropica]|uniref:patatin-like phospholipase family protein n=1 Tax=Parashewanella tropica TaxID=2547970 RepID=UPI001059B462|nr:patatin-like phospholipase family protein [Parashewanella tropica]
MATATSPYPESQLQAYLKYLEVKREGEQAISVNGISFTVTFDDVGWCKTVIKYHTSNKFEADALYDPNMKFSEKDVKSAFNSVPLLAEEDQQITTRCNSRSQKTHYQSLCLAGGGAKGVAYLGVLQALGQKRLNDLIEVSGTSAGAIIVACVSIGMDQLQITAAMQNASTKLNQKTILTEMRAIIGNHLGAYAKEIADYLSSKGEYFKDEDNQNIPPKNVKKEDIGKMTFHQHELIRSRYKLLNLRCISHLSWKRLVVVASNGNTEVQLSAINSPHLEIAVAVTASAAVPVKVKAVQIESALLVKESTQGVKTLELTDGGLSNNLPFCYFTTDKILAVGLDFQEPLLLQDAVPQNNMEKLTKGAVNLASKVSSTVKSDAYDIKQARDDPRVILCILSPKTSIFAFSSASNPRKIYKHKWRAVREFEQFEASHGAITFSPQRIFPFSLEKYLTEKYKKQKPSPKQTTDTQTGFEVIGTMPRKLK